MKFETILEALPYQEPFLFVDELTFISEEKAEGSYTFSPNEYFYEGHFKEMAVTPGVILTECMAQIGVVCLGIYLLSKITSENSFKNLQVALSSTNIDFLNPVYPGETVTVVSEKEYFRFNKLKCTVKMLNSKDEVVCKGTISGMIKVSEHEE
ncbi:3-hydroxyacyl-ACP dehydratase FabZ family protein [Marixanthomonas ophiurae]|uniref:Hydroxymyristoyl-ACP dehydratase n=1 Tax=Marixanthomonas ophiurae TaxID=387659 RepID=A0A3E1Q8P6_9FLAO|nr:3-hydroxyacyl-ACP dehydratase FabZ family protein [Marixanthomonas ophiurae]RFN58492.1 hydroxymyristoyl-ACP dehydratase [Marixanthomonas ophiurae]